MLRILRGVLGLWLLGISLPVCAADFFWVGGSGTWTDVGHWATTSGGTTFHANPPTANDRVFFDTLSFVGAGPFSVLVNTPNARCKDFNWATALNTPSFVLPAGDTLNIHGSVVLIPGMSFAANGLVSLRTSAPDAAPDSLNFAGHTLAGPLQFQGTGRWRMQASITTLDTLYFSQGKLETRNFNLGAVAFLSPNSASRTLLLGTSAITLTGGGTAWTMNPLSLTMDSDSSTINLIHSGTQLVTFNPGAGLIYNVLNVQTGQFWLGGGITLDTLILAAGTVAQLPPTDPVVLNNLTANGGCGDFIRIQSQQPGVQAQFTSALANTVQRVRMKDIAATGAVFTANNSVNEGNVTGWTVTQPAEQDLFWIGGQGEWHNPAHWAFTSGGVSGGCVPWPNDDVFFDAASGFAVNDTVFVDQAAYCDSMTWTAPANSPAFAGTETLTLTGGLTFAAAMTAPYAGQYQFTGTGAHTVRTNGVVLNAPLWVNRPGGSVTLADDLTATQAITLQSGGLQCGGNDVTATSLLSQFATTRTLNIANARITLTGADSAWAVGATGLTFTRTGSAIVLDYVGDSTVIFGGGTLAYDTLRQNAPYTYIIGDNSFRLLRTQAGNVTTFENSSLTVLDSLIAPGTCAQRVTLESESYYDFPATIRKGGYDTLNVSFLALNNIEADTAASTRRYFATNTLTQFDTDGWQTTNPGTGTRYRWIGGSGNWSDAAHWFQIPGGPNGCIPGPRDTVLFNALSGFLPADDTVNVDVDAYFHRMDWTGATNNPHLAIRRNLYTDGDITLTAAMTASRFSITEAVYFLPTGNKCNFNAAGVTLPANVIFEGETINDTLNITGTLDLDTTGVLVLREGTLITNGNTVSCGTFLAATDSLKRIRLGASTLNIRYGWDMQSTPAAVDFNASTSTLNVSGGVAGVYFFGLGKTYNEVLIESESDSLTPMLGSNVFNQLTLGPGLDLRMSNTDSLTILTNLTAIGNCPDSISLAPTQTTGNTKLAFGPGATLSGELLRVNRMTVSGAGAPYEVLFSANLGGNSGLTFDTSPTVTAAFGIPTSICLGDTLTLAQTSTWYTTDPIDVDFVMDFGNGTTFATDTTKYLYTTAGEYYLALTATYSNGCESRFQDTLTVYNPQATLQFNETDTTTCAGASVTFTGFSSLTGAQYQFFVNGAAVTALTATDIYTTTALADGDDIHVRIVAQGCPANSDTVAWNINPLPVIALLDTDADNTICAGTAVEFNASGGTRYRFAVNGVFTTLLSPIDSFVTSTLTNGQAVTVLVVIDSTGCQATSAPTVFTVNPIPVPTLANLNGTNIICAGTNISFQAGGAAQYQFYVNNVPVTGLMATNTFSTTGLTNGAVVKVRGVSNGCSAFSVDSFTITVNPIPNVTMTSTAPTNVVCTGTGVTFTATGAASYLFFVDGVAQPPGVFSGASVYGLPSLTTGQIVYVVGSTLGCVDTSDRDTFTVVSPPTITLGASVLDTICAGSSVTFTAGGGTSYAFFVNGVQQGATSPVNTFVTTGLQNGQTVSVIGYNAGGCGVAAPSTFTYVVKPIPNVALTTTDADQTICAGQPITFNAFGASQYQFFVNGISQQGPSALSVYAPANLTANPSNVTVVGTTNGCGATSPALSITVNPLPNVGVTCSDANSIICAGQNVTFTANGATQYQFFRNGFSQGAPSAVNTFSLTTLANGDQITVRGINTATGCSDFADTTFTFVVNPTPTVGLTSSDVDNIICAGTSVTFTASGAATYQFFINGISQGPASAVNVLTSNTLVTGDVITVTGATAGCSAPGQATYTMTVNPIPTVGLTCSDPDTSICVGESITFTANGASLYQFLVGGVPTGAASPNAIFTTTGLVDGQVVTVQGTNASGCSALGANAFTVTVRPLPVPVLTASDADGSACLGDTLTFTGNGAGLYQFLVNGNPVQGPSAVNTFSTTNLPNGGTVSMVGTLNGCSAPAAAQFSYQMYAYPVVGISSTAPGNALCAGDNITFTGTGALEYQFTVDGVPVGPLSPTATFTSSTLTNGQVVTVTGSNFGCSAQPASPLTLTVFDYPVVQATLNDPDTTICYGQSLTLSVSGASTYEFFVNGISQGTASAVSQFTTSTLEDDELLTVVGYNGHCPAAGQDSFRVNVLRLPLALVSNTNNLVCAGDAITFTALGADEYQFWVSGTAVGGFSANNTFTPTGLQDGDVVSVIGSSLSTGCQEEIASAVYVAVLPIPQVTPPGPLTLCQPDSVVLRSNQPYHNQWLWNNAPIPGETDSLVAAYTTGDYAVQVVQGGAGTVWGVGQNVEGQLGNGGVLNSFYTIQPTNLLPIADVAAGAEFVATVTLNGTVYTWGKNSAGQLGDGTFSDKLSPVPVGNITDAQAVAAGTGHVIVLRTGGTLMAWGLNQNGQLGLGNTSVTNFPFAVPGISNVQAVRAGEAHSVALLNDGTVRAWGKNQSGQVGDSTFTQRVAPVPVVGLANITAIAAGNNHNLALRADSTVWAWGNNSEGQLGTNQFQFTATPVQVPNLPGRIVAIAAGAVHSLAIDDRGRVYTWGGNTNGQLGDGTTTNRAQPQALTGFFGAEYAEAGHYTSFVRRQDQSVWAWGRNNDGELGDGTAAPRTAPTRIPALTGTVDFAPGLHHTTTLAGIGQSCASAPVSVTVNPFPTLQIGYQGGQLVCSEAGAVSYQWYLNSNPMVGETGVSVTPTAVGLYTVMVTMPNGCTGLSPEFNYPVNGADEPLAGANIRIQPTLTDGQVSIYWTGATPQRIRVTDLMGRELQSETPAPGTTEHNLNLAELSAGVYIIEVEGEGYRRSQKIVLAR